MISLSHMVLALRPERPIAGGLPWFRQVEGGGAFARLESMPSVPLPGCWVVRTSEKSTPAGERRSIAVVHFDVVIGVTNVRMASAGDVDDMLLAYRREVLAVLQELDGLPGQTRPIERLSGQAMAYHASDLWWRDGYVIEVEATNYLATPPPFERIENPKVLSGDTL